ncbi:MAG TPA: phenylalanine--tRNA ligase subunit beta [Chloroflexota bacterium]
MRVPFSWLREYVDLSASATEVARRLTLSGTEVGSVIPVGAHWERVVIGKVESVDRHPNADSLFLAEVRLAGEIITLVTAAPNLKVGDVVPVVLPGGRLAPGPTLQARNFRGITSNGMLCSGDELGISPDKEHIYVLEPEAPIGTELKAYIGDEILDIELTPNRPDCTGIVGIAREAAALFEVSLRPPSASAPTGGGPVPVQVFIDDPDLCPRYTAGYIEGTRSVASPHASPQWMQRRLHLCGMRPISTIVDVTNYVMLELGQPLHAFDADKLAAQTIRVRRARTGEHLVTIDGVDRELSSDTLVIADAQRPVAIAGVMGGFDSEISDSTERVVLESATFDRISIRKTARALRFATEASKRFDKGLDPELPPTGAYRALALIGHLAGGTTADGLVDVYPGRSEPRRVSFTPHDVASLIGRDYSESEIKGVLGRLGLDLQRDGATYEAVVPSWRRDIEGKADIAEEMARIVGYDTIPTALPNGRLPNEAEEPLLRAEETVRSALAAAGLQEVIDYSLVDSRANARLDAASAYPDGPEDESIPVSNPMTPEHSRLRSSLLPSLLSTMSANLRYQERVAIFEIARAFLPPLSPLPREERRLAIALAGRRQPPSWSTANDSFDFYDLKAAVEAAFHALHLKVPEISPTQGGFLHPSRGAIVRLADGQEIGFVGQVHPRVAARFDIERVEVYAAELLLEPLLSRAQDQIDGHPLPRFPAVARDLAVILDEQVSHAQVIGVIKASAGPLLAEAELFDVYRGAPTPPGKRSLAYSLSFRAPDRTLAEQEVGAAMQHIEAELTSKLAASIRGIS